jgi:hypothetical protein
VPHPAYDPYHKFVNTHGSKRCDVCDGLEDDQYHATNAQSTTTSPGYPLQGAIACEQDPPDIATGAPAPKMRTRVP